MSTALRPRPVGRGCHRRRCRPLGRCAGTRRDRGLRRAARFEVSPQYVNGRVDLACGSPNASHHALIARSFELIEA